jgi:8-hydroxy-5-deazaflavin:NADPH oxidoreductase
MRRGDEEAQVTTTVGILGGTGGLGKGLAARWVRAGVDVVVGSRSPERAMAAAEDIRRMVGDATGNVRGAGNREAAVAGAVTVVSVPFGGLDEALVPLEDALAGQVVVSVVNPLGFDELGPHPLPVAEGSAAQAIARRLPDARVTAAFHSVSSVELQRLDGPMDDDVPVVGDDEEAVALTIDLAERIEGVRSFAAGPLRLAAPLEAFTPVLISVNQRHRCHVGLRLSRLPS